jgi:exonuclease III
MVHNSILHLTQVNGTFKPDATGLLVLCNRTMALSASINGKPTCLINVYAPSEGYQAVSVWIDHSLRPMVHEIRSKGWEVIVGGDFNATPAPIDQGNTRRHNACPGLSSLLSGPDGLVDAFRHLHPTCLEYSW